MVVSVAITLQLSAFARLRARVSLTGSLPRNNPPLPQRPNHFSHDLLDVPSHGPHADLRGLGHLIRAGDPRHVCDDELNENLREVIAMLLEDGEPTLEAEFVGIQTVSA